jgi:hypothetical protein
MEAHVQQSQTVPAPVTVPLAATGAWNAFRNWWAFVTAPEPVCPGCGRKHYPPGPDGLLICFRCDEEM